jgi:hypothetical protein
VESPLVVPWWAALSCCGGVLSVSQCGCCFTSALKQLFCPTCGNLLVFEDKVRQQPALGVVWPMLAVVERLL